MDSETSPNTERTNVTTIGFEVVATVWCSTLAKPASDNLDVRFSRCKYVLMAKYLHLPYPLTNTITNDGTR